MDYVKKNGSNILELANKLSTKVVPSLPSKSCNAQTTTKNGKIEFLVY